MRPLAKALCTLHPGTRSGLIRVMLIAVIAACLSLTTRALADGDEGDQLPPEPPQGFYPRGPACGPNTSPFKVPEASGKQFVVNCGPDLDNRCRTRELGPLIIHLPVTRYLGPTDSEGRLSHFGEALELGVVPRFSILRIPVWDIDYNGGGQCEGVERDRVSFNGIPVEQLDSSNSPYLRGSDGAWRLNTYKIPTSIVRFPSSKAPIGSSPVAAMNEIRIDIDTATPASSAACWCMSVDWVALQVENYSPIVFVPGNSLDATWFAQRGFTLGLPLVSAFPTYWGIQWDASIVLRPAPTPLNPTPPDKNQTSVSENAASLQSKLWPIVRSFGATSVHLVQHSKGGLDTREYLEKHYPRDRNKFRVLSSTSIGTPHDGSILADIFTSKKANAEITTNSGSFIFDDIIVAFRDSNNGYLNLTIPWCAGFNARNVPALSAMQSRRRDRLSYHAVAANMDKNLNQAIDPGEWETLGQDETMVAVLGSTLPFAGRWGADAVYKNLARTASVSVVNGSVTRSFTTGDGDTLTSEVPTVSITLVPDEEWRWNDSLVTTDSGLGVSGRFVYSLARSQVLSGPTAGRNHSDLADAITGAKVSQWIKQVEYPNGLR